MEEGEEGLPGSTGCYAMGCEHLTHWLSRGAGVRGAGASLQARPPPGPRRQRRAAMSLMVTAARHRAVLPRRHSCKHRVSDGVKEGKLRAQAGPAKEHRVLETEDRRVSQGDVTAWLWGVGGFHLLVQSCDILAPAQVRSRRVPVTQRSRGRGGRVTGLGCHIVTWPLYILEAPRGRGSRLSMARMPAVGRPCHTPGGFQWISTEKFSLGNQDAGMGHTQLRCSAEALDGPSHQLRQGPRL